jgi:hypothetical protein
MILSLCRSKARAELGCPFAIFMRDNPQRVKIGNQTIVGVKPVYANSQMNLVVTCPLNGD